MKGFFERDTHIAAIVLMALSLSACGGGGGGGDEPGGPTPPDVVKDTAPDPIGFAVPVIEKVAPGLTLSSAPVVVEGIDEGLVIPASVKGGKIAVNSETKFVKGPVEVSLGDRIRVRAAAPDAFESGHTATLALGEGGATQSAAFTLKTGSSTFTVEPGAKKLTFKWNDMAGVDHYALYENADGASGFTKVDLAIPGDATQVIVADVPVHLTDWSNARYQLHACDVSICVTLPGHEHALEQSWSAIAMGKLKAPIVFENDLFGEPAISADGMVVVAGVQSNDASGVGPDGLPLPPTAESFLSGGAYVHRKSGNRWEFSAFLRPDSLEKSDRFGSAVAIANNGGRIAIGAWGDDSAGVDGEGNRLPDNDATRNSGAIYIFDHDGTSWRETGFLKAAAPVSGDNLGRFRMRFNSTGSMLFVNHRFAKGADFNIGTALIFEESDAGWIQRATLRSPVGEPGDGCGAVSGMTRSGEWVALGCSGDDSPGFAEDGSLLPDESGTDNFGAVFVFRKNEEQAWELNQTIKAPNPFTSEEFGLATAFSGDGQWLVVTATGNASPGVTIDGLPKEPDPALAFSGGAYLYQLEGETWQFHSFLKAPSVSAGDEFGWPLELNHDGDVLLVGAHAEASDLNGVITDGLETLPDNRPGAGGVFVFARQGDEWSQVSLLKALKPTMDDTFGGYFNGFGLSEDGTTLVIGHTDHSGSSGWVEDLQHDCDLPVDEQQNCASNSGVLFIY